MIINIKHSVRSEREKKETTLRMMGQNDSECAEEGAFKGDDLAALRTDIWSGC